MSDIDVAQSSSVVDFISKLPLDVTYKILGSLPLVDAVRTSILSTYWRNKWTSRSELMLGASFYFYTVLKGEWKVINYDNKHEFAKEYVNIVETVLRFHVGPLRKFELHLPVYFTDGAKFCKWMSSVFGKGGITELTLICDSRSGRLQLPSIVFSYGALKNLILNGFEKLVLPETFSGFPSIEMLELHYCEFNSSGDLERLINSCPQLQHMLLRSLKVINLTVHAPKLEILDVAVAPLSHICLGILTTKIKELELTRYFISDERKTECVSAQIQSLCLGSFFRAHCRLQPSRGEGGLGRLETLSLRGIPVDCPCTIDPVLDLLYSSLHLQRVSFHVFKCDCERGVHRYMTSCNLSGHRKRNLPSLKYVKFYNVRGRSGELQFMKIILECAPVLEKMNIEFHPDVKHEDEKLSISMLLTMFRAASTTAIICCT